MVFYYKQFSVSEIADLLVVSTQTVGQILKRFDENGSVDPKTWT